MTEANDTARALLAEAVGSDPAAIAGDAAIGVLEGWDSIAHMRLILAIEAHLGRELDVDTVLAIESLDDVARVVAGKP